MKNYRKVPVSTIRAGDTVWHNNVRRTVCAADIKRCDFMGLLLFGDSYHCGYKPVQKYLK